MKQIYLKFSMLLLCMVMGLSSAWATKYQLVTSADQLVAGSKYIIADGTSGDVNVISTESNTNNRRTTTVTVSNSQITSTDAMMVFKLGGASNAWTFTTTNYLGTDGFLYNDKTGDNRLFVGDNANTNKFTITFANNVITSITCNGNTSRGVMCFNSNLVACYSSKSSSYKVPQLYKEVEGTSDVPQYTITAGECENGSITVSSTEDVEGATISITATPNLGYSLVSLSVKDADNNDISVNNYKFTMPASNVVVSATFKSVTNENEIAVTYNFNDKNAYPNGFPTGGTNVAKAVTFNISGNDIIINAPNSYYTINSTTNNCGLFFGKTTAVNGIPTDGTAYLGFPAKEGYKLTKVSVTTTAGVAGSVKMNIYDASWNAMSTELSTTTSTKKEFVFNLTSSAVNTEYRLASGSSGKNLQFDNIVIIYEKVDPVFTSKTLSLKAEDKDGYWATFSSDKVTFFPTDVTVNTVVVENGIVNLLAGEDGVFKEDIVTIGEETVDGYYVPANTGVLVYSVENSANYYEVENKSVEEVDADFNMLRPASATMETDGSYKFYKLSYKSAALDALGFYYGVEGGAAFTMSNQNGAYLAVPSLSAGNVKAFVLAEGATGIDAVAAKIDANAPIYNVAGQRVSSVTKGLYIQNGKKVFVK